MRVSVSRNAVTSSDLEYLSKSKKVTNIFSILK